MATRHYVPISDNPDWAAGIVAKRKMELDGVQRRTPGASRYTNNGYDQKVLVDGDDNTCFVGRLPDGIVYVATDGTIKRTSRVIVSDKSCINNWINFCNSFYTETKYGVTCYTSYNAFNYYNLANMACFIGNGRLVCQAVEYDSSINIRHHRSFYFGWGNLIHIFDDEANILFFDTNGKLIKSFDLREFNGASYKTFNSSVDYDARFIAFDFSFCRPIDNTAATPPSVIIFSFDYNINVDTGSIEYIIEIADTIYSYSSNTRNLSVNGSIWSAFTGRSDMPGGLEYALLQSNDSVFDYKSGFFDTRFHTGGYMPYMPFPFDMRIRLYYASGGNVLMDGDLLYSGYGASEPLGGNIYYGWPKEQYSFAAYSKRKSSVLMYFPYDNTTKICSIDSKKINKDTGESEYKWITVCEGIIYCPVPSSKKMNLL